MRGICLLAAALFLLLAACKKQEPVVVAIEGAADMKLSRTVDLDSDRDQYRTALAALDAADKKWTDAVKLASVSPRSDLAPIVRDMQEQARAFSQLQLSPCLKQSQPFRVDAMQAILDGLIAFMGGASPASLDGALAVAGRADRNYRTLVSACGTTR